MADGSIPEPKGWPILGNILDIDLNFPLGSFNKFADQYGQYMLSPRHLCND